MKKKIAAVVLFALIIVFIHPNAKAYEYIGDVYDDNDCYNLMDFLETEAEGVGRSNGEILDFFGYNSADPSTWKGVTWSDDTVKRVVSIDWEDEGLEGEIILSNFTKLKSLNIKGNQITKVDLDNDTALEELNCDSTKLTSLDLSTNSGLKVLYCRDNDFTALDTSAAGNNLKELYCINNKITSLDLTSNTSLEKLSCTGNPLTQISADINSKTVSVKAEGEGYVELMVGGVGTYYVKAALKGTNAFLNWSQASSKISTDEKYDLTYGNEYDLTAYFEGASLPTSSILPTATPSSPVSTPTATPDATLTPTPTPTPTVTPTTSLEPTPTVTPSESATIDAPALALTADPVDAKIFVGGRMKITPSATGGTWSFDENYLKRDGETFTALKEGTVRISYTADGQTQYIDVTIIEKGALPKTGEDSTMWLVLGMILLMTGAGLGIYSYKKKV